MYHSSAHQQVGSFIRILRFKFRIATIVLNLVVEYNCIKYEKFRDKNWPKQEGKPKTQNTPRLAQNAPFAHVGALTGCQSVLLSVHMAKPCTLGAYLGGKRPENGRTATEFGLARPNFN
jgi:hypothetical protein